MSTPLHYLLPSSPLSHLHWIGLKQQQHQQQSLSPLLLLRKPSFLPTCLLKNTNSSPFPLTSPFSPNSNPKLTTSIGAGRSKKKPGGPSTGRIEGNADIRRQAKQNARRRSRRLSQNLFYRRNQSNPNHPDSFTEDELESIGLGYDRAVRFMSKDDPDLRHPHDWYKYGKYGPYSWRGIVVGPPIRGRFSDDRVSLIGEVKDHEEWDEIDQFEMSSDFSPRLESFDPNVGARYYWVFVRHPKWRPTEHPWQQWTLVSEVAVEAAGDQRLDKWSLMGRFGNKTRAMVTQCAAWQRPDIIYVKKPVYQCRFEPQDGFFQGLMPLVDPETEGEYLFEVGLEDGRVEVCTYFAGLCKIVRVSPKSYVDDVVNAYERMSDERKSRCLEFLLMNHPLELLHPYTKEWKAKLEEMELGCDAPDESDDENPVVDWIENEDDNDDDDDDEEEEDMEGEEEESEDDTVIDVGDTDVEDSEEGKRETNPEETAEYWNEQWKKAMSSSEEMEKLVTKSMEVADKFYKQQIMEEQEMKERSTMEEQEMKERSIMEEQEMKERSDEDAASRRRFDGDWELRRVEQKSGGHRGPRTRVKKCKIPPELFLRAAVRPFTYRNLVKEIVLMRHAFLDGDIKRS